ncbi:hypothetical protein [Aeromonas rivipollensis]
MAVIWKSALLSGGVLLVGLVKRLIGGDAKKSIPRHVECVARPQ